MSYDAQTQVFTCEPKVDNKSLKWLKNGQEIKDAEDLTLKFNGMGTYGCLINGEIYSEIFMKLPVEPELKSNVEHPVVEYRIMDIT